MSIVSCQFCSNYATSQVQFVALWRFSVSVTDIGCMGEDVAASLAEADVTLDTHDTWVMG